MNTFVQGLVAGMVITMVSGPGHTQEVDDLDSLKPQHYSAGVTGAVTAKAVGLDAANGDAQVSDDQVKSGEMSERLIYTYDTYYKPDSETDGPYEITMSLGSDYATIEGEENSQVVIGLHFSDAIKPGTYEVTDGLLDVGPNSVPVSVLVAASSQERRQPLVFSWKVEGTVALETISREQATGRFEFSAYGMNRKGQITDDTIAAKGAFKSVPYTPQDSLPDD
ncbi:hypothetical protein OR573_15430 [Halomonas sp. CH40]